MTQASRRSAAAAAKAPGATQQKKRPGPAPGKRGAEAALGAAVQQREALGAGGVLALQAAAGNRAVAGLVQAKRARPSAEDSAHVHEAAKVGIGGSSGALPHREKIQQAFGRHDVSGVAAHTGAQAAAGAQAMGAEAFTMGNHVAFAGPADLRTAAHEAAHVVQQRAGVQLAGGVGQVGDRYERHADAVAAAVVSGRSAEALLDAHAGAGAARAGATRGEAAPTQRQVQKIDIGGKAIKSIAALAPLMKLTSENILSGFNEKLVPLNFPAATAVQLGAFLNAKSSKVHAGVNNHDAFFKSLASSYKNTYIQHTDKPFLTNLKAIHQNQQYSALVDPNGAIKYADGVNDGASVKDNYNSSLACSLFALLELKPHFLGAANPEALHQIFRSNPKTKNYDNDEEVAQIRLSAGLRYRVPGQDQSTVSKFMTSLKQGDQARKFIIDPSGQAHTFSLLYSGGRWKQFDNDHQEGVAPEDVGIRVIWE